MPEKIIFTVKKGRLHGRRFVYEGKQALIVGRQNDCSIVMPDYTVSRYHCLIDISPPSVMVRDFSSFNGTFLNGAKIGQRDTAVTPKDAKQFRSEEFSMKSGDLLGLGKNCELYLEIQDSHLDEQYLIEAESIRCDDLCCEICGEAITEDGGTLGICEICAKDKLKVLLYLMEKAEKDKDEAQDIIGFKRIKMLGQGGIGQVWHMEEEGTGKQVALKILLPKAVADDRSLQMFRREAAISGQLNHKNIVRTYKFGQSHGVYFLQMELCDGGNAEDLMQKNNGRLNIDLATNIILQILDGMIYAHSVALSVELKDGNKITVNGIVHRDFKPSNILLSGSGKDITAKIADFGLSKAFEAAGLSGHTRTGYLAGTPVFMPRQQIIDFKYSKPAVDVWAVAASYYYMLTGLFPKDFIPGRDVIASALQSAAVSIKKRNAAIPDRLAEVIDAALVEKPDIGIQSALDLKKMIEGAL